MGKSDFLRKWAPGRQEPLKGMELHWFYKAWRIRAARDQKARKVAQIAQTILRFRWKFWFLCKKLGISENHHFALSRNVGIPCKILYIFKSAPPFSRAPLHFNEINGFSPKIAILGPKVHFLAPNATFRAPCAKPFINIRFWEFFWRPRAGKIDSRPKKLEIPLQNRIYMKWMFFA